MGEEAPGMLLPCGAASRAGAAAKLLRAGAESGLSRYYCIFLVMLWGHLLNLLLWFSPLISSLFSRQPEVQILQSITVTREGIFIRWERDLSARDELSGDRIGKAVYSSFVPCPALTAPLCNSPLPKG